MDKDNYYEDEDNSTNVRESETDKSFVGKFKSHVSDIINSTPLSKWFRKPDDSSAVIRRREEFEDEEFVNMQPPSKRARPSDKNNYINHFSNDTPLRNNVSETTQKVFNNFPEPVAGPSGIKSRKMLNSTITLSTSSTRNSLNAHSELLNGHKDSDSEESTSGYSSVLRVGSKEKVCESGISSKQTSPVENSPTNSRPLFQSPGVAMSSRSLFAENSLSPHLNSSLSSRRPSFNASMFGSPSFVDKTLSTKRIINSPFYSGRTIYGGASAYGRNVGRIRDVKATVRNSIKIKPVNKTTEPTVSLGKTARRILDTLEQYSTPVNDAKKIPLPAKRPRQEGLLSKYTGVTPYVMRELKVPSNKELQVPSVSDLLKLKNKERLQDTTENVRQIATSSKSALNTEGYKINTEVCKEKHMSKMKTKISSVRQKPESVETVKEVPLPSIPLPIATLPKFDLTVPPLEPTKTTSEKSFARIKSRPSLSSVKQPAQIVQQTVETEKKCVQTERQNTIEYKFSDPVVLAENLKSIVAVNNFRFSEPLSKRNPSDRATVSLNFKMPESKPLDIIPTRKTKNNGEIVKTAPELFTTGSVMDVLGKRDSESSLMEKFKPAEGTWECSACLIRNQSDKTKCVACETPKVKPAHPKPENLAFGTQFKMSSEKWECSACLVRNSNSDNTCVACSTQKPPESSKATETVSISGFGEKFKSTSVDTWECAVCMIRNRNELAKCAACESLKPGSTTVSSSSSSGFGSMFIPPSSTWECGTCMIRNKEELSKCAACESPRPPSTEKISSTGSTSTISNSFGSSFGKKDDEWECSVCMVRNKASNSKCLCCEASKPGAVTSTPALQAFSDKKPIPAFSFGVDKATVASFSFGIPANKTETPAVSSSVPASLVFGESAKPAESTTTPTSFSFGIPAKLEEKKTKTLPEVREKPAEVLGIPSLPKPEVENEVEKEAEKKPEPAPVTFKFGPTTTASQNTSSTNVKESSAPVATTMPTFNFKPPAANGELNKTENIFGSPSTKNSSVPAASSDKLFNFSVKPSTPVTSITSTTDKKDTSQIQSSQPMFKFGASTDKPIFGAPITKESVTPINNGLGSASTFAMPSSTTDVKPFAFASSEALNKTPAFSFGQSATNPTSTTPSFNFSAAKPTAASNAFSFSTEKSENTMFKAPRTSIFGSPSSTAKNGTFNFGSMSSTSSTQKAGFSFGSVATSQPAQTPAQPSFSFASSVAATPAAPTGGFNFTGAPPKFDVNAKPTFNFTDGGVSAFSAQPSDNSGGVAPQRKFRRAIRRSQR